MDYDLMPTRLPAPFLHVYTCHTPKCCSPRPASPQVEKPAALQQGLQLHDDAFSVPLRQPVPNFPLQQPVDVQKGGFKEMQHQQPSTDTTNAGKVLPDSVTSPKPKASPLEEYAFTPCCTQAQDTGTRIFSE